MFPLWEVAIEPVLLAAAPKRVVEIGALRGETTTLMVEALGAGVELHVIDPSPEFDPREHEERFAGRYFFHRGTSLDVLPGLGAVDVALVDGDHNWYTVSNELRLLAESAAAAGEPLPVLVLHDVLWPYGRRDLYYDPEQVPDEHRQPWRRAGMRPGHAPLLAKGGLNPTMANAELEGGPGNGVMTALEDFIAGHHEPVRLVVLPLYFGLAVVVAAARLERQPALGDVLDHLESRDGKDALLRVGEEARLRAMIFQHNVLHNGEAEAARLRALYLGAIRAAVAADDPERGRLLERIGEYVDAVLTGGVGGDLVASGLGGAEVAEYFRAHLDAHRRTDRAVRTDDGAAVVALAYLGTGDTDLGTTLAALEPRLAPGAVVVVAGTDDPARVRAVEAARARCASTESIELAGAGCVGFRIPC